MDDVTNQDHSAPLAPIADQDQVNGIDLNELSARDWEKAQRRYESIAPLLARTRKTTAEIKSRAAECHVHPATLYRWMRQFGKSPTLSSLVDNPKNGGRGVSRLGPAQDKIISEEIQSSFLSLQRRKPRTICRQVLSRCKELGIESPHPNTVRNRIKALNPELATKKRYGSDAARALRPIEGGFPATSFPLEAVQIDHTELDISLVDDDHRKPIGRLWLTVAIDVYSRMVIGYHLSLGSVGSLSTALCITHSISKKDDWLAEHNISGSWPCAGVMRQIHMDNAKEFHSEVLRLACLEHGIKLIHRPPHQPQYNAIIERFIGTLNREIHELSGTTFSNPDERKGYDSEKRSVMTFNGFKLWLAKYLIEVYHQSLHTSLMSTPIAYYAAGIAQATLRGGRDLPRMPADLKKLQLDFMPGTKRAVQRYGVQVNRLRYWHDVLRRWVNARETNDKKRKRLFWLKMDPRDIKFIYFFDPELKSYHKIPCRDTGLPSMSLEQFNEAYAKVREQGLKHVDQSQLAKAHRELSELEERESATTKSARRARQKIRSGPAIHDNNAGSPPEITDEMEHISTAHSPILPFEFSED